MKLPEDINIVTILPFEQNHELVFDFPHPPSWELEESLAIQEAIDEDNVLLERRYNEFAFVYNAYCAQDSIEERDKFKDALMLAGTTLYYSGLLDENEVSQVRHAGEQMLTRVIFSEIVNTLQNELPTMHTFEETSYIDFTEITYEAERPYLPSGD